MSRINTKIKNEKGYAILELIFYITFFTILSLVVISSMITMSKSFRETTIQQDFVQSGEIMERISREIRQAYGINSISTNDLILNTKDSGGANKTLEFSLSSSNIQLTENGTVTGNLNTQNIIITALTFTQITTAKGLAVKVSLTLEDNNDILNRTEDFYDTVVLRGSY